MSQVSTSHNIVALTKDSKAYPEQRLARVIAKASRDGTYQSEHLQESKCVSLPRITYEDIAGVIDQLLPHVQSMLETAQDGIVRARIVEAGATAIHDEEISLVRCIEWLNESNGGVRITREYMQEWFATEYADAAQRFIKNAIDGAAQEVIDAKVNVLRDLFAGYAGAKYSPEIPKLKAILRFCSYVGTENMDARMNAIQGKATKMLAAKEAELSTDALGF